MKIGSWTHWIQWAPTLALPALVWAAAEGHVLPTKAPAQAPGGTQSGWLVRVEQGDRAATAAFDRERWQAALTVDDLEQRERNFDDAVELARHDPEARRALDEWSRSSERELAWTARLALREAGRAGGLFHLDGPFGNRGLGGHFGDLHERLRELESMFDDLGRGQGLWVDPDVQWITPGMPPTGATTRQESKRYEIQIGPDGARVKVTEEQDGEEVVEEYEGDSLEDLLQANPELRETIQVRAGTAGPWIDPLEGLRQRGVLSLDPLQPRTDVLGIEYDQPSAALVDSLALEPGVGLVVLRTIPGTIAHILGIKRGDVVVELNDNRLYGGEDVSRVLRERQPDGEVVVALVDARGQRRSLTWRPSESIKAKTLRRTPADANEAVPLAPPPR